MIQWKRKVQDHLDEIDRKEIEKAKALKLADEIERHRIQTEIAIDIINGHLGKLAKYKCHICDCVSVEPNIVWIQPDVGEGDSTSYPINDYTTPGDLWECSVCHKWACKDHFYEGFCMECAEKL